MSWIAVWIVGKIRRLGEVGRHWCYQVSKKEGRPFAAAASQEEQLSVNGIMHPGQSPFWYRRSLMRDRVPSLVIHSARRKILGMFLNLEWVLRPEDGVVIVELVSERTTFNGTRHMLVSNEIGLPQVRTVRPRPFKLTLVLGNHS